MIAKFKIVNVLSIYNAILGCPLLTAFQAKVSIYHHCLKFPTSQGTDIVKGSQRAAREYDLKIRLIELKMIKEERLEEQVEQWQTLDPRKDNNKKELYLSKNWNQSRWIMTDLR